MAKDELDPNFFKNQVLIVVKEYLEENKEDYTSGGIEPEQIKGIVQGVVSEALKFIPKYVDQSLAAKLGKAQGIDSSKVFEMVGQATSGMEARILSQVQKEMYGALGNVIQKCENAEQEHKSAAEEYRTKTEELRKTIDIFEGKLGEIVQAKVDKAMDERYSPGKEEYAKLEVRINKLEGLEERIKKAVEERVGELTAGIPKSDELTSEMKLIIEGYVELLAKEQITKEIIKGPIGEILKEDFNLTPALARRVVKHVLKPEEGNGEKDGK